MDDESQLNDDAPSYSQSPTRSGSTYSEDAKILFSKRKSSEDVKICSQTFLDEEKKENGKSMPPIVTFSNKINPDRRFYENEDNLDLEMNTDK